LEFTTAKLEGQQIANYVKPNQQIMKFSLVAVAAMAVCSNSEASQSSNEQAPEMSTTFLEAQQDQLLLQMQHAMFAATYPKQFLEMQESNKYTIADFYK